MTLQHRRKVLLPLVLTASWMCLPTTCRGIGDDGGTQPGGGVPGGGDPCGLVPCAAQLLPPGDFRGKSLNEWGLEWNQWSIKTGLGGQSLPNTVDGVRYLPPNFGGGDFVADLTIPQGTALLGGPLFVFGEGYEDGTEDNPVEYDPVVDMVFEDAMIRTTYNGNVVLEGQASEFPERMYDITLFPEPIPYESPQSRGDKNAITAIWGAGITTIFDDLPLGQHTIRNEFNSPNFFGAASFTYNITVVPEPGSLISAGIAAFGLMGCGGRRRRIMR